ncbi:hypothetical protein ANCCAN_25482 [Ancylostoma caninum]|uniref:Uncharacterized protein n=1 Tax=Ancylostoma caninum TaxID=29170 RepID=A0A368FCZ8_ANCCA|nr:hypothetical protein ANCCAN_25482 [Ancylostoma caninum]
MLFCRERLRDAMLTRLSELVMGTKQHYSRAVLMTLMASNSRCGEKFDILDRLESMCVARIPRCARVLMLTAEFLALSAHGKGGLRSGPAANPSFTVVFEAIKKDPDDRTHVQNLYRIAKQKWMRTETDMIRAARHLEGAAQIYTQLEVRDICQKVISTQRTLLTTFLQGDNSRN